MSLVRLSLRIPHSAFRIVEARHAELVSASRRRLLRLHRSVAVQRFYRNEVIQRFLWEGGVIFLFLGLTYLVNVV